jgi:chloramphenicol 3-O phosphotransferase
VSLAGSVTIIDSANAELNKQVAELLQDQEQKFCYYHVGLSTLRDAMLPAKVDEVSPYLPALFACMASVARLAANIVSDLVVTPEVYESLKPYIADLDVVWVAVNREQTPYQPDVTIQGELPPQVIAEKILAYQNARSKYVNTSARWVPEALPVPEAEQPGKIILLLGSSSAGKSTLVKAIQDLSTEVFLNLGLDTSILSYAHRRYYPGIRSGDALNDWQKNDLHSEYFYQLGSTWIAPGPSEYNPYPELRYRIGMEARRVISSSFVSIAAAARAGFNVVSDHCFHLPDTLTEAEYYFKDLPVTYVRLNPSLEVLRQREIQRGDRMIGVAETIHHQMVDDYQADLSFDTSKVSVQVAAEEILQFVGY